MLTYQTFQLNYFIHIDKIEKNRAFNNNSINYE